MNETTFSHRINRAVHEYSRRQGFPSRDLVPTNREQRSGDPRAKPFDIVMTLTNSNILLLETKIVDWGNRTVTFQETQHEWLKVLWELEVPVHLCYPMNVNFDFDPAAPTQGRPSEFILDNSRISSPPDFLDSLERVRHFAHGTLQAHLDRLTANGSGGNAVGVFTCIDKQICDVFEALTGSTLVVLYHRGTRMITTLPGELFLEVFAELKRIVEQTIHPALLKDERQAALVYAINNALEQSTERIAYAIHRHLSGLQQRAKVDSDPLPEPPKPGSGITMGL